LQSRQPGLRGSATNGPSSSSCCCATGRAARALAQIGGVSQAHADADPARARRDGLVERTVYDDAAVDRADAAGRSLRELAESLGDWAFAYLDAIERRRPFDDRAAPMPWARGAAVRASSAWRRDRRRAARRAATDAFASSLALACAPVQVPQNVW
jgi:hypothetical protein